MYLANKMRSAFQGLIHEAHEMRLRVFPLRFIDPAVEAAFQDAHFTRSIHQVRIATLVAMFALGLFGHADVVFFPAEKTVPLLLLRFGAGWGGFVALLVFTYSRHARRHWQTALGLIMAWIGYCILGMIYVGASEAAHLFVTGLFMTYLFCYTFVRAFTVPVSIAGTAILAGYVAGALTIFDMPRATVFITSMFLFDAHVVGMAVAYALEYSARKDFSLSQRLRAEKALVEQQTILLQIAKDRAEAILNSSGDAMVLVRPDGTIAQVNPAFERMVGLPARKCVNQPLVTMVTPGSIKALRAALATAVTQSTLELLDVEVEQQDRGPIEAAVALAPIRGGTMAATGVVASLRDITHRKHVETQLRKALDRESELAELRAHFISIASHDLRTPLAVIQAAVQMLDRYRDRLTEDQRQERLAKIQVAIRQMTSLLDDILMIGRAERGGLTFQPESLNLGRYCQEVLTGLESTIGINHHFEFANEGDCAQILADPGLLRHILDNLLSNAIKYSPAQSTIALSVTCEDGEATIVVQDQGIGIPQPDQAQLGTTFFRAANVGNTPGTGLGLAIVRQCVTLHGGTLRFDSAEGHGTTVTVVLPVAEEVPL